ncbi:MAG: hypothetical protein ACUVSX_16240 [Aggregatilineales bacterium]
MELMDVVRFLHSWARWIVIVVAAAALVVMALGLIQRRSYALRDRRLMTVFSSLFGVQWLLGLVLLVVLGAQTGFGLRHYWEHLAVQTVALGTAHLHLRWKSATGSAPFRSNLILLLVVAALIVVGILTLPQGIQWRFYGL